MKVLHVQKAGGISGAERHVLALLPTLRERGVDVAACVLLTGDGQAYVDALRAIGVPTQAVNAGPDVNPVLLGRLIAAIRRARPDVVHTHLVHADLHGLLAARLLGVPTVSSVHGRPAFYRRQPYLSVGRLAGRLAHRRIAISEAVAGFLRELRLAPPDRIDVVRYGIDAGQWRPQGQDVARARHALGLADHEVAVGIASRLIPHKGHEALIDAVGLAAADAAADAAAPPIRLLVAGTGPSDADLRARAAARAPERVRFLGYVQDVRPFMHACDVIAFPAEPVLGEGFGLAALEAMAAGRPVVATPTGALDELVVDGETGLLVPPASPAELAKALVTLARDPDRRRRMGDAAAERAATHYSLAASADAMLAVYRVAVYRSAVNRS